jgi:hypothetical protein
MTYGMHLKIREKLAYAVCSGMKLAYDKMLWNGMIVYEHEPYEGFEGALLAQQPRTNRPVRIQFPA